MLVQLSTKQGIKRKLNQDALSFNNIFIDGKKNFHSTKIISNDNHNIFVLADGMGGYSGGDYASNYVIREIYHEFSYDKNNFDIKQCLYKIDDKLIEISKYDSHKSGMGTTVVAAIIKKNFVKVFNVGDSCLFHISGKSINKRSVDDNLPGANKSMITQCIGNFKQPLNIHTFNFEWKINDCLLLVSDGVSDFISVDKIIELMNTDHSNKAELLCNEAVSLGSTDDVSAMVLQNDQ
jgi:PPM family protein phosphatase